jgi:hypothetical protein
MIGKKSGNIISDFGFAWQSPEFEVNDIGYMSQTDNLSQWFWMQYRVLEPKGITRSQRYNINQWKIWDFGKRTIGEGYNVNAHVQFKSFWRIGGGMTREVRNVSNADLRGGPAIKYPGAMSFWNYVNSDNRKKLSGNVFTNFSFGDEHYSKRTNIDLEITYRPINAFNITLSSTVGKNVNEMQWVGYTDEDGIQRYIVGRLDQTIARISMRATYMVTPNLSIQYWGQPFGTAGRYDNFKIITDSRATKYEQRFSTVPSNALALVENTYQVDYDGNGMMDYSFGRPDFNFGQFRSNMVIRWEYIPGSTLFLVWTQERNGNFYNGDDNHKRYSFDFTEKSHNIFLIKYTYRFVL